MTAQILGAAWPPLSVAELVPVLAAYPGVGAPRRVAWHSGRPFAASGIVDCESGPVFVKRHDARVRSLADLAEEHAFIAHLRAAGCGVPDVRATRLGATCAAGPAGSYEVHGLAIGEDRYRDVPSWTPIACPGEARQAGAALARLHRAAARFAAPVRRTQLVVAGDLLLRSAEPDLALQSWVARDERLRGALASRAWRDDFTRVLKPLYRPSAAADPLWVHGDFHASNLLWAKDGVACVLDFGLCNRASAVFDLATAIERNAIDWLRLGPAERDIGRVTIARALIEGYAMFADVPSGLLDVLPVVHVEFALSELNYFHAITRNAADADAAYTDFLLGHAAWFAGEAGQVFLAQLA